MTTYRKFAIIIGLSWAVWSCGVDDVSVDTEQCDVVPECPAGTYEVEECGVAARNCQVRERCGFTIYCQLGQMAVEEPGVDEPIDAPDNSQVQPDDGSDDEPEEDVFDENNHAQLVLSSESLIFEQVAPGHENLQILRITNGGVGDGVLRLSSVTITGDDVFSKGESWPDAAELSETSLRVGEFIDLPVVFRPIDASEPSGSLVIQSDDPFHPLIRVPLTRSPFAPSISSVPVIRFTNVPEGSYDWQFVEVHNEGTATLKIEGIVVEGSQRFTLSFPAHFEDLDADNPVPAIGDDDELWPETLEPGEFFRIRVLFSPTNRLPEVGDIFIYTNDPTIDDAHIIGLSGNRIIPCINVTHYESGITFGESTVGHTSRRYIGIENCNLASNLQIHSIEISDNNANVFALDLGSLPGNLPGETAYIAPNDTVYVVVTFTPTDVGLFSGVLAINNNSESHPEMRIATLGTGTFNECPIAVATASQVNAMNFGTELVIPYGTILEFSSNGSYDPDGTIEAYEWAVLTRPQGGLLSFSPNANAIAPRMSFHVLGVYEIELTLYDNEGLASCAPAIVRIEVVANNDIFIELTWYAPSVQNPRVGNGTDLDLHYVHPNGQWNLAPWGIHHGNRQRNWGTEENPSVATLHNDDLYGLAPEIITHDNPVNGLNYRIGVRYYRDGGFGPSYATIRVFTHGTLKYEARNKQLPSTEFFWDVAAISWPSEHIIIIDTVGPTPFGNQGWWD